MVGFSELQIDPLSKTPVYVQIKELLKKAILDNKILKNSKLSQRTVAQMLNVSRTPVNEAFELLAAEGLITIKPRSGATVTNNTWAFLSSKKTSFWESFITKGRFKDMPSGLLNIFKKLEDDVSNKLLGDKVAAAFEPHIPLVKAMNRVTNNMTTAKDLNYFSCSGHHSLRTQLIDHLARYGIKAEPSNIITTQGIGESLAVIAWGLLGQGMTFIYERPSFMNTIMMIQSMGVNLESIPLDNDGINIEKLLYKLKRSKNAILYVQPVNHNPTGTHLSKEKRNTILSICNDLGVPIIENDMFRDFVFDKKYPRPLKAFDKNDQVIYIGSLWSGFMGFKTSWIVAPTYMIERLKYIKVCFELVSNNIVEMITTEMLASGCYYEYMEQLQPKILRQYEHVQAMLEKHLTGLAKWRKGDPAFFIWLEFPEWVNIVKLHQKTKDHLFFQGNMFDWDDTHHARFNVLGVEPELIETCIKKIAALITNK